MSTVRRTAAVACSAAACVASATPAGAATLTTSACVVSMAPKNVRTMPVAGSGFTPGARVTVLYSSPISPAPTLLTAATADTEGNFDALAVPPLFTRLATLQQTFDLTAADDAEPPIAAGTRFKQVLFGYTTAPRAQRADRIVRHTVRGFPTRRRTYLHFRLAGRTEGTVLLGTTSGPCGIASRRMQALPVKVRTGTWTVYADQRRAFSPRTRPQARSTLVVKASGA